MSNAELSTTPQSIAHAESLLCAFDRCLVAGFARLGSEHRKTLESFGRVFTGTPLATPVGEAAQALQKSQASDDHLLAMACARESLQGARYDALLAQAGAALGGSVALSGGDSAGAAAETSQEAATYMSSTRQWLVELALAGLAQLEAQSVVPFSDTLEAMQAMPELFGLSALLTGFLDELSDNVPTSTMAEIPARRWADLWSRSMIGAWRARQAADASDVSGTLRVLGADVRIHDHLVSLVAYGLLEAKGADPRIVRATISAWKVDAVASEEVWTAFGRLTGANTLLQAVADRKALTISGMPLTADGDLLWNGKAKLGKAFDPLAVAGEALAAGAGLTIPSVPALMRHPVHIAIPVALDNAKYGAHKRGPTIKIGGADVPVALDRLSPLTSISGSNADKLKQVFGLLRYDTERWQFQPLLGKDKKSFVGVGTSIAKGLKIKRSSSTLGTLQERASKLLRVKS